MNSANLISIDDITDKEKIKNIEFAANKNQVDKTKFLKFTNKFHLNLIL